MYTYKIQIIQKIFVSEYNLVHTSSIDTGINSELVHYGDDFFDILNESSNSESINLGSIQAFSYFDSNVKELNMLDSYPIIKNFF